MCSINPDGMVLFIIYVDDPLFTGSHPTKLQWLATHLQSKFQMSMLGLLAIYLGVTFHYESTGILMSHSRYIHCYLDDFGLLTSLITVFPWDPTVKLSLDMASPFLPDPIYY